MLNYIFKKIVIYVFFKCLLSKFGSRDYTVSNTYKPEKISNFYGLTVIITNWM